MRGHREWGAVYYLANFTQNRKASFTIVETETDTNIDKWLQYLMTFLSRCSMKATIKFKTNHFFIDLGSTFDLCQCGHTVRKWENTGFIGALRPSESATAFPDSSWTANTLVKTRPWAVWKECKLPFNLQNHIRHLLSAPIQRSCGKVMSFILLGGGGVGTSHASWDRSHGRGTVRIPCSICDLCRNLNINTPKKQENNEIRS